VDAQHIAIATIERVDILVSWNFKNIVKWSRIRAFRLLPPFTRAAQALAPREGRLRGIFPIQPGVIEKLLIQKVTSMEIPLKLCPPRS